MTTTMSRVPTVVRTADGMRLFWHRLPGATEVRAKILSGDGDEVAGLLLVEPNGEIDPHVHEQGGHHMYVLEGRCWVAGDLLVAGDYVHVPAGATHSLAGAGPSGCRLLYVASGGVLTPPEAAVTVTGSTERR
jgi:quercetin dioxygenase-like cupin family protein